MKKPMLAEAWDGHALRFPQYVTPKLDGIRTMIVNGRAVSRSFKPVPNDYMRDLFETNLPDGLDGEVMVPDLVFKDISGAWRRKDLAWPTVQFNAFDYCVNIHVPYLERMKMLFELALPEWVNKIMPIAVYTQEEFDAAEATFLEQGFEGMMTRSAYGPYKEGRATNREGYLLKVKRFEDSEAIILGVVELRHNLNVPDKDAFGRTKRSGHSENLSPGGVMGAIQVRDINSGIEFSIGTGFSAADRAEFWENRDKVVGLVCNYRYQAIGTDVRPRCPVYHGMRYDLP